MENSLTSKILRSTTHSPINAHFSKNSSDFVVRENPLYEFSGEGEHLIIQIQKKDLSTNEALRIFSEQSGVKMRDFGFAGLKDKMGLTTQFISMPFKFSSFLSKFESEKIKIISTHRHNNKLKIGHLKSNSFFIRLKKVMPSDATKLNSVIAQINKNGFGNYFGYQRFGKFNDNFALGEQILKDIKNGKKSKFNPKMTNFFISAFQSELFNRWLSKRIEISHFANDFSQKEIADIYKFDSQTAKSIKSQKQFFKLIKGDVLGHYPHGKVFLCENLGDEIEHFRVHNKTPMGALIGKKCFESKSVANIIESEIFKDFDEFLPFMNGSRRYAWIWADNLESKYDEQNAHFSLSFTLPKGSYATTLLGEILGINLSEFD